MFSGRTRLASWRFTFVPHRIHQTGCVFAEPHLLANQLVRQHGAHNDFAAGFDPMCAVLIQALLKLGRLVHIFPFKLVQVDPNDRITGAQIQLFNPREKSTLRNHACCHQFLHHVVSNGLDFIRAAPLAFPLLVPVVPINAGFSVFFHYWVPRSSVRQKQGLILALLNSASSNA